MKTTGNATCFQPEHLGRGWTFGDATGRRMSVLGRPLGDETQSEINPDERM